MEEADTISLIVGALSLKRKCLSGNIRGKHSDALKKLISNNSQFLTWLDNMLSLKKDNVNNCKWISNQAYAVGNEVALTVSLRQGRK